MNILVCEDNKLASMAMTVFLTRSGFECSTAADGNEAMEKIAGNDYDLVIVDIHLPFHSGLEILQYLRVDMKKATPVIIVSAFSDAAIKRKAFELGVSEYLVKPINMEQLVSMIKPLIGS